MPSASHGSFGELTAAEVAQGVEAKILLDGGGSEELIDLEALSRIYEASERDLHDVET